MKAPSSLVVKCLRIAQTNLLWHYKHALNPVFPKLGLKSEVADPISRWIANYYNKLLTLQLLT